MTLDNFVHDLWAKLLFRQTDRQITKWQMAKVLTTGPPGKKKTFPKNKNYDIFYICSKIIVDHPLKKLYVHM